MNIEAGQILFFGVWNHLNGKRLFCLERAGAEKISVRITEDTKELCRFEHSLANANVTGEGIEISAELLARIKEHD